MEPLTLEDLKLGSRLEGKLFHKSGEVLLEAGEKINRKVIFLFNRLNLASFFIETDKESTAKFIFKAKYRRMSVDRLPNGLTLSKPMMDVSGAKLFDIGETITSERKEELTRKGIKTIFVLRSLEERDAQPAINFRTVYNITQEVETLDIPAKDLITDPVKQVTLRKVGKQVDSMNLNVRPRGKALKEAIVGEPRESLRAEREKKDLLFLQDNIMRKLNNLFTMFKGKKPFSSDSIIMLSRMIIEALINDKDLLLNSVNLTTDSEYLIQHSVNVAILSTCTATSMGYSPRQVLEIAYAALLHDVGMFRVPKRILDLTRKLTSFEKDEIKKHANYSFEFLQRVKSLPQSTPVVVHQIHERQDKSGYPKERSSRFIHQYAKIISVADVYCALISDRPYRKAFSPYKSMLTIVNMGADNKLDKTVIRAFLQYVCLFPVGSWVKLNNGEKGRIIAPNSDDYTKPVVRIMFDANCEPVNKVVNLLKKKSIGIVGGVEWDAEGMPADMEGF